MDEHKKVITRLDSGNASPISINKENAILYAKSQDKINDIITNKEKEVSLDRGIVKPIEVSKEEAYTLNHNYDFVKLTEKKTSWKVYAIMIFIIIVIILIFVIYELPMIRGL
jgi:hypothetical protein